MPTHIPAPFPLTYAGASAFLGEAQSRQIPRMIATTVERHGAMIGIRYHATLIVRYYPDGTAQLDTGGFTTATTKRRMNSFIHGAVYQSKKEWFIAMPKHGAAGYDFDNPLSFFDGIRVTL